MLEIVTGVWALGAVVLLLLMVFAVLEARRERFQDNAFRVRAEQAEQEAAGLREALEGLMTQCHTAIAAVGTDIVPASEIGGLAQRAEQMTRCVSSIPHSVNASFRNFRLAGVSAVGDLLRVAALLDASRGADLTRTRQAAREVREMAGESALQNAIWLVDDAEHMTRLLNSAGATPRALQRAFSLTSSVLEGSRIENAMTRFMAGGDQAS